MAETDTLDDRVLCSDDMCVGIIGPDGKCGTCGRPGTLPAGGEPPAAEPREPSGDGQAPRVESAAPEADVPEASGEVDPDERVPCLDDMCVGILGPNGRCGTCGRVWPRP